MLLQQKKTKSGARPLLFLQQVTGIEPAWSAWEAEVLPLNYICARFIKMELVTGVEPATCGLRYRCSAIEPHQHCFHNRTIIPQTPAFCNRFFENIFRKMRFNFDFSAPYVLIFPKKCGKIKEEFMKQGVTYELN